MPDGPILRALSAALAEADTAPDGELLRRFVGGKDTTAFELLVRRHSDLVWAVCRAVLPRDVHAAEDAFQATFLALARKAGAIREASAAGWLFRVARNAAGRVRARAARHAAVPLTADTPGRDESADAREVGPVVAEEVDRLAAKFRDPVVLCVLQGHTHAEAARVLGWAVGTVASRLSRAKDRLRARLTRRGVAPAAALLSLRTTSAPATVVHTAIRYTATPAVAPPALLSLTEGVLSAMHATKANLLATLAAVALVATGTIALALNDRTPTAKPSGLAAAQQKAEKDAKELEAKELAVKELKAFQGNWRLVKWGWEEPDAKLAAFLAKKTIIVEGDVMTIRHNNLSGNIDRHKLTLYPDRSPKEIDLVELRGVRSIKGRTRPGIYKFDGDTLTLCTVEEDSMDLPKDFNAGERSGATLWAFERVKDEKK